MVYRGPFVYRRDASGALTFESASYEGGDNGENARWADSWRGFHGIQGEAIQNYHSEFLRIQSSHKIS